MPSADEQFTATGRLVDEDLERELALTLTALVEAIAERARMTVSSSGS